jgi:hypothetical protein
MGEGRPRPKATEPADTFAVDRLSMTLINNLFFKVLCRLSLLGHYI